MAIYYVDTFEGSDSSDGSTWATAWKTCYPLKALYGNLASVQNVEVRFAKTTPIETDRTMVSMTSFPSTHAYVTAIARPLAGFRKAVVPDYMGGVARVMDWGGTLLSPFTSISETSSPAYRPYGTYKFRIDAPAGASGLAVRWTLADGNFSAFQCFEFVAVVRQYNLPTPSTATASLEFSTDAAGTNIIWSRPIPVGTSAYEARMCLLGDNDLPSTAAYAFIRFTNPGTTTAHFECSSINAVLPHTHANYVGLRLLYVPNDKMGSTLAPVTSSGLHTVFTGLDGPGIDNYRDSYALPRRTWSTHKWAAYPYAPEALMANCGQAGRAANPLKVSGGWNKVTGVADGITALDAANLRWFNGTRRIAVDVRRVAVTFRRSGGTVEAGTPGIMEYLGYGYGKVLNAYAEHVYLAAGGAGCVGEVIGYYYSDLPRESLVTMPPRGFGGEGASAAFRFCNTALELPFAGGINHTFMEDSAWGSANVYHDTPGFRVKRCRIVECRPVLFGSGAGPQGGLVTFDDCDIVSTIVSNSYQNEFVCTPWGYLENCRLWGAHTGPLNDSYPAKNLTFIPLPGVLGSICTHGADIEGLSISLSDAVLYTTDYAFSRTGISAEAVRVRLKNANLQMVFKAFVPPAAQYDYRGHDIDVEDVVLHRTGASEGPVFHSARLSAYNLTLVGAWPALQDGIVRSSEVDNLVITDAATKIVSNFRFAGANAGWGRVCATYRNVVHPLGIAGFLGAPSPEGISNSGAAWFHTPTEEMWVSSLMMVQRDLTLSHSGMSSWRLKALQNVGAISAASFMLGVVPVTAGVPVTYTATVRRSSRDIIGGIYIRPGVTRAWTDPAVTNAPSLQDIVVMQSSAESPDQWITLSISYTPHRDGLVEMHAGIRGAAGSSVWLDTFKVTQ